MSSTFLTEAELAAELRVSRRWVQLQMKSAGLPFHRMGSGGRLIRFRLEEVIDWVVRLDAERAGSLARGEKS